jgi:hypothetical protein
MQMRFEITTAQPQTTYRHYEVEADSTDEATALLDTFLSSGSADGVDEIGESVGPDDEPQEIIDVRVIDE